MEEFQLSVSYIGTFSMELKIILRIQILNFQKTNTEILQIDNKKY